MKTSNYIYENTVIFLNIIYVIYNLSTIYSLYCFGTKMIILIKGWNYLVLYVTIEMIYQTIIVILVGPKKLTNIFKDDKPKYIIEFMFSSTITNI